MAQEFVAYGFFCRTIEELSAAERQAMSDFLDRVQLRFGMDISPGVAQPLGAAAAVWCGGGAG